MTAPTFGPGLYGCCGSRKPSGETQNYCPTCKREYMTVWRSAHHRRGDPYYERQLEQSNRRWAQGAADRAKDREWRGQRVRNTIANINDAGVTCTQIARLLGHSPDTVFYWRNGSQLPTPRNAERLYRLGRDVEARLERGRAAQRDAA